MVMIIDLTLMDYYLFEQNCNSIKNEFNEEFKEKINIHLQYLKNQINSLSDKTFIPAEDIQNTEARIRDMVQEVIFSCVTNIAFLYLIIVDGSQKSQLLRLLKREFVCTPGDINYKVKLLYYSSDQLIYSGLSFTNEPIKLGNACFFELNEYSLTLTVCAISEGIEVLKESIMLNSFTLNGVDSTVIQCISKMDYPKAAIEFYTADPELLDDYLDCKIKVSEYLSIISQLRNAYIDSGLFRKVQMWIVEYPESTYVFFCSSLMEHLLRQELSKINKETINDAKYYRQEDKRELSIRGTCRLLEMEKAQNNSCNFNLSIQVYYYMNDWVAEDLPIITESTLREEARHLLLSPVGFQFIDGSEIVHEIKYARKGKDSFQTKEIRVSNLNLQISEGGFYALGFSVSDEDKIYAYITDGSRNYQLLETFYLE